MSNIIFHIPVMQFLCKWRIQFAILAKNKKKGTDGNNILCVYIGIFRTRQLSRKNNFIRTIMEKLLWNFNCHIQRLAVASLVFSHWHNTQGLFKNRSCARHVAFRKSALTLKQTPARGGKKFTTLKFEMSSSETVRGVTCAPYKLGYIF